MHAAEPTDPRDRRPPLTRARCTAAAVAVADTDGLRAVTMRRVATDLGIEAMSLYHHVRNKDDLLDGMVDAVFGEIALPPTDERDWVAAMRVRAASLRAMLLRHPWVVPIIESRTAGPTRLRHHDAVLGCCRRLGMSIADAAHAFMLIDSFVYGFVMQELNLPFSDGDDLDDVVASMPADVAADYPHLAELTTEHVLRSGYSFADEFDFGLDLVLRAMAAAASATPAV